MSSIAALFTEHGQPLHVPAEKAIVVRGTSTTKIFLVQSGRVLIHSTLVRGRDIGIEIVKQGGVFGLASIIRDMKAVADATALTDCDLLVIERDVLEQAVQSDPQIAGEALNRVVNRLVERTRQVEGLAAHSVKSRLARWLLENFHEQGIEPVAGATVQLDASQKLIATMAGVSRETVNRQFKKWTDSGIIAIAGKNLRLLKADVVHRLASSPG